MKEFAFQIHVQKSTIEQGQSTFENLDNFLSRFSIIFFPCQEYYCNRKWQYVNPYVPIFPAASTPTSASAATTVPTAPSATSSASTSTALTWRWLLTFTPLWHVSRSLLLRESLSLRSGHFTHSTTSISRVPIIKFSKVRFKKLKFLTRSPKCLKF